LTNVKVRQQHGQYGLQQQKRRDEQEQYPGIKIQPCLLNESEDTDRSRSVSRLAPRLSSFKTSWQAAIDPASGATYYWNAVTNESTWDPPAELRYGVGDEVKARF
jgi:hypothetical protein